VAAGLTPEQVLALLLAVAATWSAGSPELTGEPPTAELTAARRAAVVLAVERLT